MFKNKQWVCNFIALIILLTGMCVDDVKADSMFLCPQTVVMTNVEKADAVLTDVTIETTQLLCTRNAISSRQIAAQIINVRKTIKLSMVFLCVAVFALLLSNFYTVERVVEYPRLSMRTAVLKFIHNTDGKK